MLTHAFAARCFSPGGFPSPSALNRGQFGQNGGEGIINVIAGEQFFTQR
ncbi:hypothetical protein RE140_005474, partial [Klebsiella variicola]|nr:hypothetical protein [Klebsiella variicola]